MIMQAITGDKVRPGAASDVITDVADELGLLVNTISIRPAVMSWEVTVHLYVKSSVSGWTPGRKVSAAEALPLFRALGVEVTTISVVHTAGYSLMEAFVPGLDLNVAAFVTPTERTVPRD